MIRALFLSSILALGTTAAGCGGSSPPPSADKPAHAHPLVTAGHDMDMSAGEAQRPDFAHKGLVILDSAPEVSTEFTEALNAAIEDYFVIAAAFAADDAARATGQAEVMLKKIEAITSDGMAKEAADAWTNHREVLRTSLHQVAHVNGLAAKREHFSHASEAVYCAVRSFGGITKAVEVAHCPMAFGDVGAYWLAPDKTIANPYLGASMPTCGTIEETLAAR